MKVEYVSALRLLIATTAMVGCEGPTVPGSVPEAGAVSLSVSSVTLAPGAVEQVVVKVPRQTTGISLAVKDLPTGLVATFSHDVIPAGDTLSTLFLVASPSLGAMEVTVTVTAARAGLTAAHSSTPLLVRVSCPGYAIPTNCPPFPTGGNQKISGTIYEQTTGGRVARPGAMVWAWVQLPSYGYSAGSVAADGSGRYTFPNLPQAVITLQAGGSGFDQPCGSTITLGPTDATADIDIVSEKAPAFNPDPPPPGLVGTVYEMLAGERKPVGGARVFVETWFETVVATTVTDELGRYSLCRLTQPSPEMFVTPVKPGYTVVGQSVSVSGVTHLDLEIKRP